MNQRIGAKLMLPTGTPQHAAGRSLLGPRVTSVGHLTQGSDPGSGMA